MSPSTWIWVLLVVACGGSSPTPATPEKHEETAAEKKQRELQALYDQEPKIPYALDQTKTFQVSRECGQGPFRVEGKTIGADYGEDIELYVCSPHELKGRSRLTIDGTDDQSQSFGFSQADNARCRATATEVVHAGDAGATSSATSATSSGTSSASKGITTAPEKLSAANVVISDGEACPKGSRLSIEHYMITVPANLLQDARAQRSSKTGYYRAGKPFHIDVWFPEPNDLRDATFVLRQHHVEPSMTAERWNELEQKRKAWFDKLDAFVKANDDLYVHEDGGAALEPPPAARSETQPPKPSVHAAWIPGYYHHDGSSWVWIAGFWRVPDEDVKQNLTATAPSAPPPARDESTERARTATPAARTLVWTDGHWLWDGARWVWIEGAWRVPPEQGVVWTTPTWRPRGATFVFVPGGWGRR